MKVVILAGGYGTRLSELTKALPKPMVEIGGNPILWHIMNIYSAQGFNEFIIALGYKGNIIKNFFINYHYRNVDLTVDTSDGKVEVHSPQSLDWKVTLVETGPETMTGGRIKRLSRYLDETFLLTYGDGVSNVNIGELVNFHRSQGALLSMTVVHPTSRYGKVKLSTDGRVEQFVEKPEFGGDWINGGFMVVEPEFLSLIDGDRTVLEREPFEIAAASGRLAAFKHFGFWHCMDTLRDQVELERLWATGAPEWRIW